MNTKEKIINGLYGQSICDAVGDPFEFRQCIEPGLVTKYANEAKLLEITDDSQMALFGFQAMIEVAHTPVDANFNQRVFKALGREYLNWYETQQGTHIVSQEGLFQFPVLFQQKAPGNTCLNSLRELKAGKFNVNDSKGCGSVMRLLPILLLTSYGKTAYQVMIAGKISGAITHHHKENYTAIETYLRAGLALLYGNETKKIKAKSVNDIGEGWTAQECVDIGIWSYQNAKTFEELMELSICHDGDSDSTGAVAGSLWGLSGKEVPRKYIDKLDNLQIIKYIQSNLH